MIQENIRELVNYGVKTGLIEKEDVYYVVNKYLELFKVDEYEGDVAAILTDGPAPDIEKTLAEALDYCAENGVLEENSIGYRDLLDTKIMEVLVPKPSEFKRRFDAEYAKSPKAASDFFYDFSRNTDYIRTYRVKKDMKWKVESEYGDIDITINLSKPEKDPKAIAAAKTMKSTSYPKCLLCPENEGYAGHLNHPARGNHRIVPVTIAGDEWGFQYSPYVYYNEHCIVFNKKHIPMKIDEKVWGKLFDFVKMFPHYFLGSNADLPIVGGSILSHEHFQGGNYEFAMAKAPIEKTFKVEGFDDVECGIVHWPLSVIRLKGANAERVGELATRILNKWRGYTDEAAFIFAETDGEPHNTITPIARMRGDMYELDLALRNNITTEEHPLGVYHPHEQLHHIKKENIGLIEVMGLAVLPARLKGELNMVADAILEGKAVKDIPEIEKHAAWVEEFLPQYKDINADNVMDIVQKETGKVFVKVLEDAGVFKCTEEGRQAFDRFIAVI